MGVLDAMPSTNLKPEDDEEVLEEDRVYRTTYMFSATMPQVNRPSTPRRRPMCCPGRGPFPLPAVADPALDPILQLRCCPRLEQS